MNWLQKLFPKAKQSSGEEVDRYEGKPLLRILDVYVMDTIGAAAPDEVSKAQYAVKQVFGGADDWRATVRAQLQLEDSIDESIQGMWQRNQEIARQNNVELTPEQFTIMVVDQNLSKFR